MLALGGRARGWKRGVEGRSGEVDNPPSPHWRKYELGNYSMEGAKQLSLSTMINCF